MLSYHFKNIILIFIVIALEIILSMIPEIMDYQPLVFPNSCICFRFFYLVGALLPVLILISSILCFFSHRNLDIVIKVNFLIGFFAYFIYALYFYTDSVLKILFIVICLSMLYTNIFMLLYKLILRVKNKIFVAGLFCSFFPLLKLVMLLIAVLLSYNYIDGEEILYNTSPFLIILLMLYSYVTSGEKSRKISYKNLSIRLFVYLINILKEYFIIRLFLYLLICGVINGLTQQYLLQYVSLSNKIYFNFFFFSQGLIYIVLFVSIILISSYLNSKHFDFIFSCSSFAVFLNIVFILAFENVFLLKEVLMVNVVWYHTFLFFHLLTKYIRKNRYHKFNMVLILGFIMFLFGLIFSEWVNVGWFVNRYIVLLLILSILIILHARVIAFK
ncbi:hypothetical protein [Francisella sp. LA112445]|uniref:hypothetical protein n=1 Tax=Francisella sp. LA112445 TaxID=1395624 RepID=UPI001788E152|nr:hypothetical protein [Francisella sp. LA112445]QIW11002.1 hypothetical protein FIP56_09975 [Francisella sp. LA112445]